MFECSAGCKISSSHHSTVCFKMNSRKIRENTFRVEFSNLPKKPTSEEVHAFVAQQLGISRTQLVRLQLSHTDECAFVKVVDFNTAQHIVQTHDNQHDYEVKGVKYKIRIHMADGGVDVRLYDLSEHVSDEQISRHMAAYGEVLSVNELLWSDKHHYAGMATGIRQVKMVLHEPIKSYITIDGETTYVQYAKQRPTCRHCGEFMHTGISCVQNKKLLAQKVSVNERLKRNSYAGAVRGASEGFSSNEMKEQRIASLDDNAPSPQAQAHADLSSTSNAEVFPPLPNKESPLAAPQMDAASVTNPVVPTQQALGDEAATETNQEIPQRTVSLGDISSMSTDESCNGNMLESSIVCNPNGELVVVSTEKPLSEATGKHKNKISNDTNPFIVAKRGRGRSKKH